MVRERVTCSSVGALEVVRGANDDVSRLQPVLATVRAVIHRHVINHGRTTKVHLPPRRAGVRVCARAPAPVPIGVAVDCAVRLVAVDVRLRGHRLGAQHPLVRTIWEHHQHRGQLQPRKLVLILVLCLLFCPCLCGRKAHTRSCYIMLVVVIFMKKTPGPGMTQNSISENTDQKTQQQAQPECDEHG